MKTNREIFQIPFENKFILYRPIIGAAFVANRAMLTKPVSPHVLRHTFAVNCVQRGVSTAALKKLLGHDRLETTEIYLNLSPEQAIQEFREKVR